MASNLQVTTNHQWRPFVYRYDVPPEVLANEFDHLDEDELDGFFCYRGSWYHLSDFECGPSVPEKLRHDKWDGWHGDSYFSGVAIRLSEDNEQYQVATVTC